jgi:uncharacterized membrane protein YphA (DoxX/SURF4 family)
MITTSHQRSSNGKPTTVPTPWTRTRAVLRWPFTNRFASVLWLALRLCLGWIWLQFSLDKFQSGWLSSDPIGAIMQQIAKGTLPVPLAFYHDVARTLIGLGVTPLISHVMPFLELAVALAFLSGVLVVPAAIASILLNVNILLSGIGVLKLDGRFVVTEVLFILAWRVVGLIGVQQLLVRGLRAIRHGLHLEPQLVPVPVRRLHVRRRR